MGKGTRESRLRGRVFFIEGEEEGRGTRERMKE